MLVTRGSGEITIGQHSYRLDTPAILYLHPNDIISWSDLELDEEVYYVIFKKSFIGKHAQLRTVFARYGVFLEKEKAFIRIGKEDVPVVLPYFDKLQVESKVCGRYSEDIMQALIQLLLIESMKIAKFPEPDGLSEEFTYIHQFFELLEKEVSEINNTNPIRIRTVKEFAADLDLHPNYLNALLKKKTGQNVSVHIRDRLLEESKTLLLQTNWSVQDISYSIGFADQPNFNLFFKRNTGHTPADFRKAFAMGRHALPGRRTNPGDQDN